MPKWFVCIKKKLFDTIIIFSSIFVLLGNALVQKIFIYFTDYYYIYCLLILLSIHGPFIIICWFSFPRLVQKYIYSFKIYIVVIIIIIYWFCFPRLSISAKQNVFIDLKTYNHCY